MGAFQYLEPINIPLISICIGDFQDTIPHYYDNMTLVQCIRKMSMAERHMWMKLGTVEWQDAGQQKRMRVSMAFHRRERFAGPSQSHYYLSVGMNHAIEPDVDLGAKEIAEALIAECREFDDNILDTNGHRNHLYLAYQKALDLSNTRLGPIVDYASRSGWLGPAHPFPHSMSNDGSTVVWPDLLVRKIKLHP